MLFMDILNEPMALVSEKNADRFVSAMLRNQYLIASNCFADRNLS